MAANLQHRTRLTFAWVAIIPFLLGISLFWASGRYQSAVMWVSHTRDVLAASETLQLLLTEVESNQRGYLLSRESDFLNRYELGLPRVRREVDVLRQLTIDNLSQQSNVARLSVAVDRRLSVLDDFLFQYKIKPQAVDIPLRLRLGVDTMAAIHQICDQIKREETRLLSLRRKEQRDIAVTVAAVFAIGTAVTVFLLLGASKLINRYADERDRSEADLKELNADLEMRVTERTAELTALNEKLSRSNQDLTQFAYVASHDLQEPLRTVASYAGLLARRYQGKLDDQADRYINFVVSGAKRMQALVQDLLTYSRTGTQSLQFERVELEEIIDEVRDSLRLALAEKHAQLSVDDLPAVSADRKKLGQVFQNLIANALKFTKPTTDPQVHVGVRREQSHWLFWVSDNGIGFEAAYAERIFGIFQRLHSVGTYAGTGMGLAICKRVIEAHGGRIWAESVVDVGSKFCFTLPVMEGKTSAASNGHLTTAVTNETKRTNLIGRR